MDKYTDAQKEARRAASQRWREKNPDKVKEANKKKRVRIYDPVKSKEWRLARLENPEYRAMVNAKANERATAIRQWLSDYKASAGCVDCGFNDPRALDFDHVTDDKQLNVCFAKSLAQAKKEIAKCVVRCANCHRIVTHERRERASMSA